MICPECEVGKHDNCDGRSWDNELDDYVPCPCEHGVPVTQLPGWHEHRECLTGGEPLRHLHGEEEQAPHTHLPVRAWGPAVFFEED